MTDHHNRFADLVDLDTVEGVAIYVWLEADGSVIEEREDRGTTSTISTRHFHNMDEVAWAYAARIQGEAA